MALIAAYGRAIEPDSVIDRIDELADRVDGADADSLCWSLFGPGGFAGNTVAYHDPDNSLFDRVLDRRLGIPISLAVLAMEVGRRHDVGLVGIGMPGHFLLRDALDEQRFYDAFEGGRLLDPDGARARFALLHGAAQPFRTDYLEPTPAPVIVSRVLNNLLGAYSQQQDRAGLLRALALHHAMPGVGPAMRRQFAAALTADGQYLEAAEVHDEIARTSPEDAAEHTLAALRLRAQLN